MNHRNIARASRDLLIEHIDGQRPFVSKGSPRLTTLRSCLTRGWIRFDDPGRPKNTVITEAGRRALALALADWADALVRAGFSAESAPAEDPGPKAHSPGWGGDRHSPAFVESRAKRESAPALEEAL